jgi:hypothetical protein
MKQPLEQMVGYNYLEPMLGWLALLSFFTFVLSLVLIPWFVGRLPQDCFLKIQQKDKTGQQPSVGTLALTIFRNIFGFTLLLAGLIMLFLPGQGLLTILLGLLLISFPGKQKLVDALVGQPKIQRSLDWLRKKRKKPPFFWPEP